MTDNKAISFGYAGGNESPSAALTTATSWVRTNLLEPTALSTSLDPHVDSLTDVVMHDTAYRDYCEDALGLQWTSNGVTGLRGMTTCRTLTPGGRCQQAHVRISTRYFDVHTAGEDRWIVCHEVGHAVGLAHRPPTAGCMNDCVDYSSVAYTVHDLAHFAAALDQPRTAGTSC